MSIYKLGILVTGFVSCVQIFPICSLLLRLDVKKLKNKNRGRGDAAAAFEVEPKLAEPCYSNLALELFGAKVEFEFETSSNLLQVVLI